MSSIPTSHLNEAHRALSVFLSSLDKQKGRYSKTVVDSGEVFTQYAALCKRLCYLFSAINVNLYAKSNPASPNLGGILTVRGAQSAIALQYIKIPVDNQTVAGHVYSKAIMVNLANVGEHSPDFPDLNPKRMTEIDRRLQRQTREVLAIPLLHPKDKQVVAVLEITNHITKKPFSKELEDAINAVAPALTQSFLDGFLSLLFPIFTQSDKKNYQTQLQSEFDEDDLTSSAEDIKPLSAANSAPAPSATQSKASAKTVAEEDEEYEEGEEGEEEEGADDSSEETLEESAEETAEEAAKQIEKNKKLSPQDLLKSLRVSQKPDITEYPFKDEGDLCEEPYDYLAVTERIGKQELRQTILMAETEEKPVEAFLILKHSVTLTELGLALSKHFHLPYSPYDPTIEKSEKLIGKLKPDYLQRMKFMPMGLLSGNKIKVITTQPRQLEQDGVLQQIFGNLPVAVHITTELEFQFTFEKFFGEDPANNIDNMLENLAAQYGQGESDDFDPNKADAGVSDNELVILVNRIITDAYNRKVSDIHIEPYPGKAKTRVRFRVDGSMMEYLTLPPTLKEALITRIKVMANMDISDRRKPQDGKIAMKKFSNLNIELRVATIPTAGGLEDAVLRILASGEPLPLEKLGILPENEAKLIPLIEKPYGILFVCGPTGSGKTTTLHSILKHLNTVETKIWTAEDPVEITQAGLRQVQVNRKAGMDFATTMRAFLRADPDIIMVGEMRDHETVSIGVEASLTGHMVLSTLHTNSAPEAIVRLLDMGMDPFNFADALLGILAQRLAKRLCDNCKTPYEASEDEFLLLAQEYSLELLKTPIWVKDPQGELKKLMEDWRKRYSKNGKIILQRATGCSLCNAGYKGRIGLHELLVGTDRSKRLIQQKATVETLVGCCLEEGMLTLKMDGIHKVFMGITDIKQVRSVCIK